MRVRYATVMGALACGAFLVPPAASAFSAPRDPHWDPQSLRAERVSASAALEGWQLFRTGGAMPTLSGSGRLPAGPAPRASVAAFVTQHGDVLGLAPGDLVITARRTAGTLQHVFGHQNYAGLPVIGTHLAFAFSRDGHLVHFTARTAPEVHVANTVPALDVEACRRRAEADLDEPGTVVWHAGELAVFPARLSGLETDRLVWRLRCSTHHPLGAWRILVDAQSGEILVRESLVLDAAGEDGLGSGEDGLGSGEEGLGTDEPVTGTVEGSVAFPSPWGTDYVLGFPNLTVRALDGATLLATGITDGAGAFDLGVLEADTLVLEAEISGPYADIRSGTEATAPPLVTVREPPLPAQVGLDDASTAAARAAFFHTATAHARLKQIDPGFTHLDRQVYVLVDDSSSTCNAMAYVNPELPAMRFLIGAETPSGETCANSAEIPSVVYHEYGHLITMWAYYPQGPSDAFHEAFADFFACSLDDTSSVGAHFYGPGTEVRTLDRELSWPVSESCEANPYCFGSLLSCALWDMRKRLIDETPDRQEAIDLTDHLFHFMRAGKPLDFQSCLMHLLLQDDDDGNLDNGTPHLETIADGFDDRNIADFAPAIVHRALSDTESDTAGRDVRAEILSIYPPDPAGVKLFYSLDGGAYEEVPMTGTGREFSATIPPLSMGTTVRYYLTASDTRGHVTALPPAAPAETFTYDVDLDEEPPVILHIPIRDLAADQDTFWVSAEIRDNLGVRAWPRATVTITRPDTTWSDERAMVPSDPALFPDLYQTFLRADPRSEDAVMTYSLSATDDSHRENQTRFPAVGDIELHVLRGRHWDFESPTDLEPHGDWARGMPAAAARGAPYPAPSGSHVIGTGLGRPPTADQVSVLVTPELDLSGWGTAQMSFRTWYQMEEHQSGGWIQASRNHGASWNGLVPSGGYPKWFDASEGTVDGHALPKSAFTGESDGWQEILVALDHYRDGPLMLRFLCLSRPLRSEAGWFIDDLRIVESQLISAPAKLYASEGTDRRVDLAWSPPTGIDTSVPTFLGYQLYRGTSSGDYGSEPIHPAPLRKTWWIDGDVTNGQRYYYAVTSLFESAESRPSVERVGYPYRAALAVDDSLDTSFHGISRGEEILLLENAGSGDLKVEIYHGDSDDSLADILPQAVLDGGCDIEFTLLAEDPAEGLTPDLGRLQTREVSGHLQVRLGFHDSLPDPRSAFTLYLYLDTDLSRATGMQTTNLGADYLVKLGAEVFRENHELAQIVDAEGKYLGRPSGVILQQGLDSIEVAVPLTTIGSPHEIALAAQIVLEPDTLHASFEPAQVIGDRLPDPPRSSWLETTPTYATVLAEAPFPVTLSLDLTGYMEDDYAAQLFLTTNDPDRPLVSFPVSVHLHDLAPQGLTYWATTSRTDGLLIEWSPADPEAYDRFRLFRWIGSLEDESNGTPLAGGAPIGDATAGVYSYLDRGVESGQRYFYRLAAVVGEADTLRFSPAAHPIYDPPDASRLVLEAPRPNPARESTALRFHVPPGVEWDLAVVDVTGRLVRRFSSGGSETSGTHLIQWNGTTQRGLRAPLGVYYAILRGGGQTVSRALILIR